MYQIVRREQYSDVTFRWDVFAPDVARAAQPGQFVMVRLHEEGERIPLTIADFDRKRGTITLVIQALGKTTRYMLQGYKEGDWILDFAGPLGKASEMLDAFLGPDAAQAVTDDCLSGLSFAGPAGETCR